MYLFEFLIILIKLFFFVPGQDMWKCADKWCNSVTYRQANQLNPFSSTAPSYLSNPFPPLLSSPATSPAITNTHLDFGIIHTPKDKKKDKYPKGFQDGLI